MKLPAAMLADMFDRATKSKMATRDLIVVKRIERLMTQVDSHTSGHGCLQTVMHTDAGYLPADVRTATDILEKKAAYKAVLKKRLERQAAGLESECGPVWREVIKPTTRVN